MEVAGQECPRRNCSRQAVRVAATSLLLAEEVFDMNLSYGNEATVTPRLEILAVVMSKRVRRRYQSRQAVRVAATSLLLAEEVFDMNLSYGNEATVTPRLEIPAVVMSKRADNLENKEMEVAGQECPRRNCSRQAVRVSATSLLLAEEVFDMNLSYGNEATVSPRLETPAVVMSKRVRRRYQSRQAVRVAATSLLLAEEVFDMNLSYGNEATVTPRLEIPAVVMSKRADNLENKEMEVAGQECPRHNCNRQAVRVAATSLLLAEEVFDMNLSYGNEATVSPRLETPAVVMSKRAGNLENKEMEVAGQECPRRNCSRQAVRVSATSLLLAEEVFDMNLSYGNEATVSPRLETPAVVMSKRVRRRYQSRQAVRVAATSLLLAEEVFDMNLSYGNEATVSPRLEILAVVISKRPPKNGYPTILIRTYHGGPIIGKRAAIISACAVSSREYSGVSMNSQRVVRRCPVMHKPHVLAQMQRYIIKQHILTEAIDKNNMGSVVLWQKSCWNMELLGHAGSGMGVTACQLKNPETQDAQDIQTQDWFYSTVRLMYGRNRASRARISPESTAVQLIDVPADGEDLNSCTQLLIDLARTLLLHINLLELCETMYGREIISNGQ
ncbi:hypothetical protein J6590_057122 [Homalodisca vitripennis]|nr:hypothetical protein J6590_057122 [Homalodisca vitripennis]